MKIVLVTSAVTLIRGFNLGSSKDITYRINFLQSLGHEVALITPQGRNDQSALSLLRDYLDGNPCDVVLFEHTRWPQSARFVANRFPSVRIVFRSHNEEFLHSLDMLAAFISVVNFGKGYIKRLVRLIYRIINSLYLELMCFRYADNILACNDQSLPYFLFLGVDKRKVSSVNTHYDININKNIAKLYRGKYFGDNAFHLLVMGSADPTYFNDHSLKLLNVALDSIERHFPDFNLNIYLTGLYSDANIPKDSPRFRYVGVVDDPLALISASDGVFLPTPLGRGIKTRIYDSLILKKPVLAAEKVTRRLPAKLKEHCSSWDGSTSCLMNWITKCTEGHEYFKNNVKLESDLAEYREVSNKNLLKAIIGL